MLKFTSLIFLLFILISIEYTGMAQIIINGADSEKKSDESFSSDSSGFNNSGLKAGEIAYRNPRIPNINSKNLLPNSSFELGTDGWSSVGKSTGWGGDLWSLFGEIDSSVSYEGKNSLLIELGPGKTEITYYDVWPVARQAQTSPLAANRGWMEVDPGEKYILSAYMRADRDGIPAKMSVYQSADPGTQVRIDNQEKSITLSKGWTRYSFIITASYHQLFIALGPNLANENDSASVWIDAVQFEKGFTPTGYTPRLPLEIGLSTGKFGNIFTSNETVQIKFACSNNTASEVNIPVQCDVIDFFDKKSLHSEKQITVGAGGKFYMDWPISLPGTGHYNLTFSWKYENKDYSRSFPLVLIDPYLSEDSPFGVNHAPTDGNASTALQLAGIKWERNWSVNWGLLEPQEGNLSFSQADEQILNSEKRGFKTIALLPPLPSTNWGSSAPGSVLPNLWYRMAYMPTDTFKLMNFISNSIDHYKDKLKYWEFLNEPVWTSFCLPGSYYNLPGANYIPADYIGLLKKAYAAMKAADPSCIVVGGFSAEPWRYTKEFILADGLKNIDILNIHNYGGFAPPESYIAEMDALLSQMDQYGERKPIWITEYSYYGVDSLPWTPWKAPEGHWGANLLLEDERQCADWTMRYNTIMFARGVDKIFYHQPAEGLINDALSNMEFAVLGEEGVPRKLYAAQAAMAKILGPEFIYAGPLENNMPPENSTTNQVQGYSFQCNERAVLIAWVSEKEKSIYQLKVPEEVEIFTITGTKISSSNDLRLSNSPVYIVSNSLSAKDLAKSCSLSKKTFQLEVLVKDAQTKLPIAGINISVDTSSSVSDSNGIANFNNVSNIFVLNITDSNCIPVEAQYSISSDTTLILYLTWNGIVTFTLQDQKTQEKFWGVTVSFGSATQVSDVNGQVFFSVPKGSYMYSINKIFYKPVTGTLAIDSDTSIIFPLERLSAYAKFWLKDGITPLNNAIVIVNDDSIITNNLGIALFTALPIDYLYSYFITVSGYFNLSGEFYLSTDTIINLKPVQIPIGVEQVLNKNKIRIWPNPVSDFLYCSFPSAGSDNTVLISDLAGNTVFYNIIDQFELKINLGIVPSGAYIIRIQSRNDDFRKLIFKN